jgi:hypothetical protein
MRPREDRRKKSNNELIHNARRPVGVFHALAISRGNSLLKSRWIQDFLEFYGRNLFKAESSATCGTSAAPLSSLRALYCLRRDSQNKRSLWGIKVTV